MGKVTEIKPSHQDSHQSQPAICVKFFSFDVKDTYYQTDLKDQNGREIDFLNTTQYTVVSDVLNCSISSDKNNFLHTAELTLASGDINYLHALSAGDHAMIWLFDDTTKYEEYSLRILNNQQSNQSDSGLKFIGRVHSVRQILNTQANGVKTLRYLVTLKGFAELETVVYFNPYLKDTVSTQIQGGEGGASSVMRGYQFFSEISKKWADMFFSSSKTGASAQELVKFFVRVFLGDGPQNQNKRVGDGTAKQSPNGAYLIPAPVANILGITSPSDKSYTYQDLLNAYIGIQNYGQDSYHPDVKNASQNQKDTKQGIYGYYYSMPDNFSGVTLWSLITGHANTQLNECYTTLRRTPSGAIMPHLIVRQQPYTSDKGQAKFKEEQIFFTKMTSLPKWKISSAQIIGAANIGTSDSARINFVQVYGNANDNTGNPAHTQLQQQIYQGNMQFDSGDILRNGTRVAVINTMSDITGQVGDPSNTSKLLVSEWAKVIGDFYLNGHLKISGSITTFGIMEPIQIGDNVEFDGITAHIEGISHQYQVMPNGIKAFQTTISFSHGLLNGSYPQVAPVGRQNIPYNDAPGYTDEEDYVGGVKIKNSESKKK